MTPDTKEYEVMRGFLLGTLSEEDRQLTEKRLLTEHGFLDELLIVEEELIEDYVNDDLSAESRSSFEQHFLCSPERQQKIKFALAFNRYTSKVPVIAGNQVQDQRVIVPPAGLTWVERWKVFWARQAPVLRVATVSAVAAFMAVVVWLAIPRTSTPTTFATVTISISSGDRSEGPSITRIKLPQNVDALKISLTLPESNTSARGYRVEWENNRGVIKPVENARDGAQSLIVVIPSKELERGQNALRLYVTKSDGNEQRINGNYFFTIE